MTTEQWEDAWYDYYERHDAWVDAGSQGTAPNEPQWDSGGTRPPPPPHP